MHVDFSGQALALLNGMSKPQTNKDVNPWTKNPTLIQTPSNPRQSSFGNPFGRRQTQKQVITKRGNAKATDERQPKRRKMDHTHTRDESVIIVEGPARKGGQSDDPTNTRATSVDELDVIPSNTSPDRYPRADGIIQGALSDDPIIIDNETSEPSFPAKGNVQRITAAFEANASSSTTTNETTTQLTTLAKNRMKKKKGAAPTLQIRPLNDNNTIYFESSSLIGSSPCSGLGSGRLMWQKNLQISTNLGPKLIQNMSDSCKSVKIGQEDPNGRGFLQLILQSKGSEQDETYAFWFKISGKHEQQRFTDLVSWLSSFKKPDKIRIPDIDEWNAGSKTEAKSSAQSSKVAALERLRDGKVEPLPSKAGLSRKSQRYTPDQDLPVTKNGQVFAQTTSVTSGIPSSSIRRSTRKSTTTELLKDSLEDPNPIFEPEKVILSYPQGSPGAVNVTNADLARLRPGEFLNDTLIEFGLKLWLKDMEDKNPEIVNQIHIFNSFFYKKLNQHKKGQQGYDSVKKWTSKFDIFQKKFIIVPINENMHWYLAIIYEPEHVLREAPIITPTTRGQAKVTQATVQEETEEKEKSVFCEPDRHISETMDTSSEGEIERDLNQFQASCTIDDEDDKPKDIDAMSEGNGSDLSYVADPKNSAQQDSMEAHQPDKPTDIMLPVDDLPDSTTVGVSVESFYGRRGKGLKVASKNVDAKGEDDIEFVDPVPRTYIFVFDSLGIRHTTVGKNLSNYLKMEALDKKGVANASNCESKVAAVPIQPNFCDCGLYLLHFAKVFMTDPASCFKHIVTPKPKMNNSDYNKLKKDRWRDQEVPSMRGYLKQRIMDLSTVWLKDRPTSKTLPIPLLDNTKVDDSDSDVDIVETIVEPKGKQRGTRVGQS